MRKEKLEEVLDEEKIYREMFLFVFILGGTKFAGYSIVFDSILEFV